jgi:predicted Rossmann fold flavoprotein
MGQRNEVDVAILGAGAAGLICAIEAARRGRRVLLIEHAESAGKKILISGGGRCNFTNRTAGPENYICSNPHFVKSALARFTPQDFIVLVERHGIAYHEKTLGQLFCDRSAQEILQMLLRECGEAGVQIQLATRILSVALHPTHTSTSTVRFRVETTNGAVDAASLVVATGGLSIPKMGATGLGYDLARQFGHSIVETRPGLVPLVFTPQDQSDWCDLAGVSTEVVASLADGKITKRKTVRSTFREKMLLTHRGVSGPAILQISSYWRAGEAIAIDLAPSRSQVFAEMMRPQARRDLAAAASALRGVLPSRLAERWIALRSHGRPADLLSNAAIEELERELHGWRIPPAGTEGYAKAEVTVGGVDTAELDARTMQSRRVEGLYFAGEVVDVTGWLGGYNFQWAWASGVSSGRSA